MARATGFFRKLRAADGRIKIAVLSGVSAVAVAVALLIGIVPAFAGAGTPSAKNVQPVEMSYGGGPGACSANITVNGVQRLPSAATHELWINNPINNQIYTGPDGTQVKILNLRDQSTLFDFQFVNNPQMSAFDVVINGGANNTHYDYDNHGGPGPVRDDQNLHAPTKGGNSRNLYNISHVNICYDVYTLSISGTKFHDRDTDGVRDNVTDEPGISGWTITAFDASSVGKSATTTDGSYTISGLAPGTYKVCEQTNTSGLPDPGTGFSWAWKQSALAGYSTWGANTCVGLSGYLPGGHTVTVGPSKTGIDFGNHRQVTVTCNANVNVVVSLGGDNNNPLAEVTFPAGCTSGTSSTFSTTFDVGRSNDSDAYKQFVVFGGDASSSTVLTQTITWDPETAVYNNGSLVVPTTQVQLIPGGAVVPVTFCSTLADSRPNSTTPQCLDSQSIDQANPSLIQLTENYRFLGDPGNFR